MSSTKTRQFNVYKFNGYSYTPAMAPGPVTVARPQRPMTLDEFRAASAGDVEVETLSADEFRSTRSLEQCEHCGTWDLASRIGSVSRRTRHSCYRFPKDPPPRYEPASGVDAWYSR